MRNDKPVLLLCDSLLKPVVSTKSQLDEIARLLGDSTQSPLCIQGVFVLALARVESMLTDILQYYLRRIPEKLNDKDRKVTIDDLLSGEAIQKLIEKELIDLSYDRLEKYLDRFCNVLSIDRAITEDHRHSLMEIKETRNLLLHNNLLVNDSYIEKAGPKKRATIINKTIIIDRSYAQAAIASMLEIVNALESALSSKYKSYTKLRMLQSLWGYFFESPIMPFDDYWYYDADAGKVTAWKEGRREGGISSSEKIFLGILRSHFGCASNSDYLKYLNMKSLDPSKRKKLLEFLSIANELWFE